MKTVLKRVRTQTKSLTTKVTIEKLNKTDIYVRTSGN